MDQNQLGTEPCKELWETSIDCNRDMFLRNLHEIIPLRLCEERLISLIDEFEQLEVRKNQEELNPVTELNACFTNSCSVLLHVDSTNTNREIRSRSFHKNSIFLISYFLFLSS